MQMLIFDVDEAHPLF